MMSKFYYYFLTFLAPSKFRAFGFTFAFAFFSARSSLAAVCVCRLAPITSMRAIFCVDSAFSNFVSFWVSVSVCAYEWNWLHLHGKVIRLDMRDQRNQRIIQQFSIITSRIETHFDFQRFLLDNFIHIPTMQIESLVLYAPLLRCPSLCPRKYRSRTIACSSFQRWTERNVFWIFYILYFFSFIWRRVR